VFWRFKIQYRDIHLVLSAQTACPNSFFYQPEKLGFFGCFQHFRHICHAQHYLTPSLRGMCIIGRACTAVLYSVAAAMKLNDHTEDSLILCDMSMCPTLKTNFRLHNGDPCVTCDMTDPPIQNEALPENFTTPVPNPISIPNPNPKPGW